MALNTTDEVFIEAPAEEIYRALITIGKDVSWWPGAESGGEGKRIRLSIPAGLASRVRMAGTVDNVRPDEGVTWLLDEGELHGRAEWWLEPFKEGTIVHYFLEVEPADGGMRSDAKRVERHRIAVRRGMNALKDEMERA